MARQQSAKLRKTVLRALRNWQVNYPRRTQDERVLTALRLLKRLRTDEIRDQLDVMHPAGCIKLLRLRGHVILTTRYVYATPDGCLRYMACYVYVRYAGGDECA